MSRVTKPDPPTYNGYKLTLGDRRAILTASTKGYVFRAGKLGCAPDGADKRKEHRLTYISLGVLKRLYKAGIMTNGAGYGQYVLTDEYRVSGLYGIQQYESQLSNYRTYRAELKAQREARKAKKEAAI